jgi:uncharacterized transporter YbjL
VVGRTLGDLPLPGEKASVVVQVRRGDADILPRPDLVLEFGDRVGVLAHRADFAMMRKYFGDSIKATAEFSYISIGIGMAKFATFGVAGVLTAQIIAIALLIGALAFPGAFVARALVERLPLHVHTAVLDAVVIAGGAAMIANAIMG